MTAHLAIIPARGGSKRLPNKNLALLAGRPLLDYTARAALAARKITATVVSTDGEAIAAHARSLGLLVPAMRPAVLATDLSPTIDALQHALAAYEEQNGPVDIVVVLQPTSPFRRAHHIDEAIALFESARADTVVSVRQARDHPFWTWRECDGAIEPFFSRREMGLDRGGLPAAYAENGALYIARRDRVLAGELYGPRVLPYLMSEEASIDIDTPLDLAWAELLMSQGLGKTEAKSS